MTWPPPSPPQNPGLHLGASSSSSPPQPRPPLMEPSHHSQTPKPVSSTPSPRQASSPGTQGPNPPARSRHSHFETSGYFLFKIPLVERRNLCYKHHCPWRQGNSPNAVQYRYTPGNLCVAILGSYRACPHPRTSQPQQSTSAPSTTRHPKTNTNSPRTPIRRYSTIMLPRS